LSSKKPPAQGSAAASVRVSDALFAHIRSIHAEVKGEYGWPTMWRELQARGVLVGKEWVRQTMKLHGTQTRGKRKFVVTTARFFAETKRSTALSGNSTKPRQLGLAPLRDDTQRALNNPTTAPPWPPI
jgi:HTH-like domain